MGMFSTIKGKDTCPLCGGTAEWQTKQVWLTYKDMEIFLGAGYHLTLDENMNGYVTAYCWKFPGFEGCGQITVFQIKAGELIQLKAEQVFP